MAERLYWLAELDERAQARLEALYGKLRDRGFTGHQTRGIPYHLTLGSRAPEDEAGQAERLGALCRGIPAFDLRLGHLGLFGQTVLFLSPNPNEELLALLRTFFPECGKGDHDWSPHITLLMDEAESIGKALPVAAEAFEPFCARVEAVSLYAFFPKRLIRRCALG